MTQLAWLGEIAWKGSVVLVIAFGAAVWLRRESASARHLLWTAALSALVLLPAAIAVASQWRVATPVEMAQVEVPRSSASSHSIAERAQPEQSQPIRYPWLMLWVLGGVAASVRFGAGTLRTWRMVRRARPAKYAETALGELRNALGLQRRVRVLESGEAPVPLACGVIRPSVVLPKNAGEWTEARLRSVLRHELAHIQRHDLAAQIVGQAACCIYWFHPAGLDGRASAA